MPSFDSVNYAIRPNKSVERKIVFACLVKLRTIISFHDYRYIGLGSLWFVDFLMAHKLLGIASMTSIEQSDIGHKRSEFNRPFSCISVEQGEATAVIPTLNLEQQPSVTWFDYDTSITGPVLTDLGLLSAKTAANSIVIVTINAKKDELPSKDANDQLIEPADSLRNIAGDAVPTPLAPKRLQQANYPKLLCEVLENHIHAEVKNSGRKETFIKLFDLVYSDGTPMVTIGGIIATSEMADKVKRIVSSDDWEGIANETIAIPPLTMKEKMALDRKLPSAAPPSVGDVHALGFALKQAQIDAYHRYYLYYPMFGEFLF